jgi:predicted short-subunit dehydrogenase-like oxidoreductase (DUF2520 family)
MAPERPAADRPRLNIVGCGRAAGSLARLWLEADAVRLGAVLNRSASSTARAIAELGAGRPAPNIAAMPGCELWMIGCGDDQIESVATHMAAERNDLAGVLSFHLAGRFGREVLSCLEARGADTAALHPVRSLTHEGLHVAQFEGTACVVECAPRAEARMEALVRAVGGTWLPVQGIDRGLYHASVSIISNVTKAVAWKAQNWLQHSGLSEQTAATVTHQLLHTTMADLFRAGARQSITGPVVRGDTRTVEAHLAAIAAAYPRDTDVYRVLARTVLELARERGDLSPATLARFESLLSG